MASGEILEFKQAINTLVDHLRFIASELNRVSTETQEGQLTEPIDTARVPGTWKEMAAKINSMAAKLGA